MFGRVYEYFIGEFANSEGKRGGEYFTPLSIVRTLVAMLEPVEGKVFDPCCGSGGMFVQSDVFAHHSGKLSFFGQEAKEFTYRLCRLNLFIHGIDGDIKPGNSYTDDQHADLKADYVLANPPFNDGAKGENGWGARFIAKDDARLRLPGETNPLPLSPRNANTMWILHFLAHLKDHTTHEPGGTAGFVMATGELSNSETARLAVRKALVEGGYVDCVVTLTGQLFANTQIPCALWFLSKNRDGGHEFRARKDEILFIDGRKLGALIPGSRKQKQLSTGGNRAHGRCVSPVQARSARRTPCPASAPWPDSTISVNTITRSRRVVTSAQATTAAKTNPLRNDFRNCACNFKKNSTKRIVSRLNCAKRLRRLRMVTEADWQEVKLESVADEITVGYVGPMTDEYRSTGIPFFRSLNIKPLRVEKDELKFISPEFHKRIKKSRLRPGDVVIVRTGDPGTAAVVPESFEDANCADLVVVRPFVDNSIHILASLTTSTRSRITSSGARRRRCAAAFQRRFSQTTFAFACRNDTNQDVIAETLRQFDRKLELNRRMNRTLEDLAAALFRSWFVDFDPVVAKTAGRKPAHLRPDVATLFPAHFQDSALGPIPQGWRVGTVNETMDVTMGQSPPGSTYNQAREGTPFFQGCTDFGFRFPTNRVFCTAPTRFAKKGDVLLSVRAPVGDTNIAHEDCAVGRGLAALRSRNDARSFPLYALRSQTDEFASFQGEGTLFGAINGPALRGLRLIIPPAPIMVAFEKLAGPWDSMIEHNEGESRTLAALRDTLLPKLLSGELRVQQAEKLVAAAS